MHPFLQVELHVRHGVECCYGLFHNPVNGCLVSHGISSSVDAAYEPPL